MRGLSRARVIRMTPLFPANSDTNKTTIDDRGANTKRNKRGAVPGK